MLKNRKIALLSIMLTGVIVLSGCYPKASLEAVQLSQYLAQQTAALKELHYNLIDKWMQSKKKMIDEKINAHFLPKVIQDSAEVLDNYKKESNQKYINGLIMIMGTVAEQRTRLYQEVEDAQKEIKERLDKRYAAIFMVNSQLTTYLQSIVSLEEERSDLLEGLGKVTGIDLKDIEEKLDGKLMKLGEISNVLNQ